MKSFAEINAMLDDPAYGLGWVDEAYLLPWVYPGNITGMDVENVVKVNRARFYNFANLPNVDSSVAVNYDDDYEGDDDVVRTYLWTAVMQRRALATKRHEVIQISSARQLAALLYMMTHWESGITLGSIDRTDMTVSDMQECLDLFVAAFHETAHCHIKVSLLAAMEFFFDTEFAWDIKQVPELQKFLDAARFSETMTQLERIFKSECLELFEYLERERVKAEKKAQH